MRSSIVSLVEFSQKLQTERNQGCFFCNIYLHNEYSWCTVNTSTMSSVVASSREYDEMSTTKRRGSVEHS
jgi:hypothetical protein